MGINGDQWWLMVMTINVDKTINQPFGNGKHTTYKNGDDWGIVYDCLPTLKP